MLGYPWYKVARISGALDMIPGLPISKHLRGLVLRLKKLPHFPQERRMASEAALGGPNAWIDACGMIGLNKLIFYSDELREKVGDTNPWVDLGMDLDRAACWHPLNRGVWVAARMTLAGHLLQAKGDRVSMAASVEARYPFLDEEVFDFTARLHPRWKLRGFRDKVILRELAARWLPPSIAQRRKAVFRAPLDGFQLESKYIEQLLSTESLMHTNYFDTKQVHHWRRSIKENRLNSMQRLSVEMGLTGVIATQLWHHIFIENSLTELP